MLALNFNVLTIALSIAGVILILIGSLIRTHSKVFRSDLFKNCFHLETISNSKPTVKILDLLSGKKQSRRYIWANRVIAKSEILISLRALWFLKILCFTIISVFVITISLTNHEVTKQSIMSKPQDKLSLFYDSAPQDYSRNAALYKAVIAKIGEEKLKQLDNKNQISEIIKQLPIIMHTTERDILQEKANQISSTFNSLSSLSPISYKAILIIISAFWLPELVLILWRILLGSTYRKEAIKLENIFELLGTVKSMKTISILSEMSTASNIYKKHIKRCLELFKTEKELALDNLKLSVKNQRFSKLVDILRVYSMTDRKLALQIMERHRLEKEEEILLTAEEDIDLVDLVAFISIVPILLQLTNLLLKPMLDMIYEVFKFV